ncbi:MAG: CAP domain-containing protein [Planctomycetota bacterium]
MTVTPSSRPLRACLAVLTAVLLLLGGACGPKPVRPPQIETALALAKRGQLDEARAALAAARRLPSAETFAKDLDIADQHVASFAEVHARFDEELRVDLRSMTHSQLQREYIINKKHRLKTRYEKEAFDALLSQFDDWIARVEQADGGARPKPRDDGAGQAPAKDAGGEPDKGGGEQGGTGDGDRAPDDGGQGKAEVDAGRNRVSQELSERELMGDVTGAMLAEVDRMIEAGRFAAAFDKLREELPRAGADADRVRARLWQAEDEAGKKLDEIVAKARSEVDHGRLERALAIVDIEGRGFPREGRFGVLHELAAEYRQMVRSERLAKVTGEAEPGNPVAGGDVVEGVPSIAELQKMSMPELRQARSGLLVGAREYEARREFSAAVLAYRQVAQICRVQAPWLVQRYLGLSEEMGLLAHTLEGLAQALAASPDKFHRVDLGDGRRVDVTGFGAEGFDVLTKDGTEKLPLAKVSDAGLLELLRRSVEEPRDRMGVAMLAERAGMRDEAEKLLASAVAKDPALKGEVDRAIARLRGEGEEGAEGYVLEKGRFVSVSSVKRRELLAKFEKRFKDVLTRSTAEGREKAYEKVATEDEFKGFLVDGLLAEKRRLHTALTKNSFKGSYKKLKDLRVELDKRRAFAKELIFDTVKYFYPYRPPEVSGEKYKEYLEVQKEVDARVDAIREIWDGKEVRVTLPGAVQDQLEDYRWLTAKLEALGERTPELDEKLELLAASSGAMDIRTFAVDERERKDFEEWDRIEADNEVMFEKMVTDKVFNREQCEQIRITNAYRRMFGHRPLRCDTRLMEAAQGHSEEMNRLGYFSHTSPTPGLTSPGDRMRKAGYPGGGGENIAINGSPMGAHTAWIHSSGHHRNLLNEHHWDMGIGVVGRYYTQNFGSASAR